MLLELEDVKHELRVSLDHDDELIVRTMDSAVKIVLDFLKVPEDEYEDVNGENDFPDDVYAAVVRVIMSLYDDPKEDPLTPAVRSILHRRRDPAFE